MKRRILYCLLSLVLLCLPWLGLPGYTLLVAFVPLFCLQQELATAKNKRGKPVRLWPYILVTFALWSALSVWWVGNSVLLSPVAGGAGLAFFIVLACVAVTTFVIFLPFMAYHYVWRRAPRSLAYAVLISAWVGYEFIFLHGQITFPWLILGNGFANSIEAVQWYEYTGALGGSVWVWACNIAVYEALRAWKRQKSLRLWIRPAGWIGVPLLFSLILFWSYREQENPLRVQVIQPNFDPYEKFEALSFEEQTRIILGLAMDAPSDVDYFVAPETAIDEQLLESGIETNSYITLMRHFLSQRYPEAEMVIGATTLRTYPSAQEASETARPNGSETLWYDIYNTALQIDTHQPVGIYHKSKLVAGAEMVPYAQQFPWLLRLSVNLGGASGLLGTDPERSVFTSQRGVRVGVPICWEAVFGEYTTGFVDKGAEVLFVISNDAWWGNTAGHRQLFAFSRLRAIETRRSIARSANTGISGFIDQRGRVIDHSRWDQRVALSGVINRNDRITFYVRFGDMTGRICLLVFALCVLYYIAYRRKKKDLLYE
jgi:apolipoprotein N-acyltransferase